MAVSGTTTFNMTRDDIIEASLRTLGVLDLGSTPDAATVKSASNILNMMLKDWETDGIKLWTTTQVLVPYVPGQVTYTIGPDPSNDVQTDKPLRLIQAFLRNNSMSPAVDIPMIIISNQEYNFLGSKFSTGTTNSVFYKPLRDHGELKVFLAPDVNTASNYLLHLNVQRPIYDINKANEDFDFPSEWFQALRWGLASEMVFDFGLSDARASLIIQRAQQYKDRLMAWDVEYASTFFQVDQRMKNYGFR